MAAHARRRATTLVSGGRRFRGLGRGRKTRRALERGGAGPARRLNRTLGDWDGVRITPMFGRWGYFVGDRLFACFPLREKDRDLWIRLTAEDQSRALREAGVRPHRRFAARGWIEIDVATDADVPRALRWLRQAHSEGTSVDNSEGPSAAPSEASPRAGLRRRSRRSDRA
jgi:Family of unknown function (DUF5519)